MYIFNCLMIAFLKDQLILFVCKYVPYYCHRLSTQLHLTNIR
jgi:hypothetical protein